MFEASTEQLIGMLTKDNRIDLLLESREYYLAPWKIFLDLSSKQTEKVEDVALKVLGIRKSGD